VKTVRAERRRRGAVLNQCAAVPACFGAGDTAVLIEQVRAGAPHRDQQPELDGRIDEVPLPSKSQGYTGRSNTDPEKTLADLRRVVR